MTNKEMQTILAAVRRVADLPGADRATIAAVAQSIETALWEEITLTSGNKSAARFAMTGVMDLSGKDRLAELETAA